MLLTLAPGCSTFGLYLDKTGGYKFVTSVVRIASSQAGVVRRVLYRAVNPVQVADDKKLTGA